MWEYSHEGKQLENKWVFRRLQKTGKVCADVMSGGRLFQSRLPALGYCKQKQRGPRGLLIIIIINTFIIIIIIIIINYYYY